MNLANKITELRIVLIPFMIFFYLASFIPDGWGKVVALIIFIIAAMTDMLDGYCARKYNQVSEIGKFLDPIADKLLMAAALLLVVCDGTVIAPYGMLTATIIIAREFLIAAFRQIAATKNFVMGADLWGKAKTVVTNISLTGLFLLSFFYTSGAGYGTLFLAIFEVANYILLGASVALTIISGINYFVKNKKVIKG